MNHALLPKLKYPGAIKDLQVLSRYLPTQQKVNLQILFRPNLGISLF